MNAPKGLTTGEAEAWRAGWRAAREAAEAELRRVGMPETAMGIGIVLRAMEPPA